MLLIVLLLVIVVTCSDAIVQIHVIPLQTLVHSILWAVNYGLLAYALNAFGWLPRAEWLQASLCFALA